MPPERDPEVAARDRNPAEVALARLLDGDLFKDHVLSRLHHTDVSCLCNVNSGLRIYIKAARPRLWKTIDVRIPLRQVSRELRVGPGERFDSSQNSPGRHLTLAHAVEAGNLDVIKRVMAALREANPDFRLPIEDWNAFRHRAWLTNQVEVMEWVVTNGTFDKDSAEILSQDDMLRHLVDGGHLPMLKWWFEKYGASDIILSKRQFTKAAASQGRARSSEVVGGERVQVFSRLPRRGCPGR